MKNNKPLSDMMLEELWELFPIELSEHNPEWKNWFREEEELLLRAFGSNHERIRHIGSTAVEGLLAKPTIDILLETPENVQPEPIRKLARPNRRFGECAGGRLFQQIPAAYSLCIDRDGILAQSFPSLPYNRNPRPIFGLTLVIHFQAFPGEYQWWAWQAVLQPPCCQYVVFFFDCCQKLEEAALPPHETSFSIRDYVRLIQLEKVPTIPQASFPKVVCCFSLFSSRRLCWIASMMMGGGS